MKYLITTYKNSIMTICEDIDAVIDWLVLNKGRFIVRPHKEV